MIEEGSDLMAASQTMAMTLTQKIIAIAVTIIIISTVALPVISDAETETKTGSNASVMGFALTDSKITGSVSITINSDYNPVVGSYVLTTVGMKYIVVGDTFAIRHTTSASYHDKLFVDDITSHTSISTTSVTIGPTSVTFTDTSEVSHTLTYNTCMYASESGKYGFFSGSSTFYVNSDSQIYTCMGVSATNSNLTPTSISIYGVCSGTIAGLTNYMNFTTQNTVTSMVITGVPPTEAVGNGSYAIVANSSIPYTAVTNLGTYSGNGTTGFIAPLAYDYESGNDYATLFNVVSIMLILVPLMIAVRMIALKRN